MSAAVGGGGRCNRGKHDERAKECEEEQAAAEGGVSIGW